MKVEAWIFGLNAAFFALVAPAYWFITYDPSGTSALVMTALLTVLVTFYLGFHASKMEPRPLESESVLRKTEDSGFAGTGLNELLQDQQIQVLSVCGVMSEMCVAATARGAMERGYDVVLAHDSHATFPVPPYLPGEPEVPAEHAARVAEWSLGDTVIITPLATDVRFVPRSKS